ncbi:hypothetical protein [Psychroflexus sediminis]|uniref:Holin-X, holin superfamily III n=1 Tax=Psychroflexus sediminis TaxID=470826 RepID=A0A1G7YF30_9FLAO|nr:hypothetical protein [Psychroflexus sediminis]SDG95141.1 hypothetical protein SAMN04488027_11227 [Psychroflexus sediminis]
MKNSLGNHFENFTQDTQEAINHSLDYYKLDLLKKTALSLVTGGQLIIKVGILILVLFFVSIGFAFLIGNKLDHVSYGFFIVGGIYIVFLIFVSIFGKKLLEQPVLSFLNKILSSGDKLNEELRQELSQTDSSDS